MESERREHPALLIIDMVKDNFDEKKKLPLTPFARGVIDPLNRLQSAFRAKRWPVVFSTDAFGREDFIFSGRMKPHSLRGTEGARVIEELGCEQADLWLPKPRFSAFFKTPLESWLKERQVTLCAVAGVTTPICVLATALDAVCCDFKTVLLEDCTAAGSRELHEQTLGLYRRTALYPLLRVASSTDLLAELEGQ